MERAGLEFILTARPSEPVYVDRDMWEKVVLNLVSNAFKFTLAGMSRPLPRRGLDRFELSVEDTGDGHSEDELARIFDRFHRVEGARGRTHEGTGIGLAFVQELARLHGGSIASKSAAGKGSRFPSHSERFAHLPARACWDRARS